MKGLGQIFSVGKKTVENKFDNFFTLFDSNGRYFAYLSKKNVRLSN